MTEEEIKEPLEIADESFEDLNELIGVLKPQLISGEDGQQKLLLDLHSGKQKINELKRANEICILSNDMLGLTVQLSSKKDSLATVQEKAHKSLKWMMKNTPCRIPLGVN